MPNVTPGTNCMTIAEDKLAAMLASTSAFQSWTGTNNEQEADGHVYIDALPRPANNEFYTFDELVQYGNHAIVYTADDEGFTMIFEARGSVDEFGASGVKHVMFCEAPVDDYNFDPAQRRRDFNNATVDILIELSDLSSLEDNIVLEELNHISTEMIREDHFPENGSVTRGLFALPHLSATGES